MLRRRLAAARSRHPAVAYALCAFDRVPQLAAVAEVGAQVGYSARRFIALFKDEVGLTPKAYCRVRRFQAAIERLRGERAVNWSALAADCGFYDQSHLVHEFRAFAGLTPGELDACDPQRLNHIPL